MTMQTRQADQIGPVAAVPIILQPGTWQYRLVVYVERLQKARNPTIVVLRAGDCPVNWFKCIPDGRTE